MDGTRRTDIGSGTRVPVVQKQDQPSGIPGTPSLRRFTSRRDEFKTLVGSRQRSEPRLATHSMSDVVCHDKPVVRVIARKEFSKPLTGAAQVCTVTLNPAIDAGIPFTQTKEAPWLR